MRIMTTLCRASRILAVSMSCNVNVRAAHNVAHVVTSTYDAIPEHLSLTNVVVIHRHGDRSQISREIGPNFPETADIKEIWTSKLPVDTTMMTMAAAAHVPTDVLSLNVEKAVYTGWDEKNIPYGQLTELGAHQLMNIGRELRRRYVGSLLPSESFDASTLLYCRSTNFCRTIQSIRSLLSGLLKVDGDDYSSMRSSQQLPVILSRAKKDETMFPGADGPCSAMTERRAEIFAESSMESSIPNYSELEQKMRDVLGYGDRVSWLPIKEILTCYEAHGIKFPEGITDSDADRVTDLAGWMWGTMYNDDALNRLAIGRFLRELLDVVHSAVFNLPTPPPSSSFSFLPSTPPRTSSLELEEHAKMMIFSGHDSTLVPVLCALGIYDGVWPPYASYLSIEIAESLTDKKTKFVRAIYNDQDKIMIGCGGVWCPYELFHARLESLALTHEEYMGNAQCSVGGDGMVDEDLKATLGEK